MNQIAIGADAYPSTRPYSQWFEPHPDLGISLIDHLYNRLDGAYPHKWRSNFPDQQAIDNWAESWVEAFEEEGITPADVKLGIKECRRRFTWPPSCAEFITACKPATDPMGSYHEAVTGLEARAKGEAGIWSHPAVFWAASLLSRDLMGQSYGQVKEKWAAVLKAQLARTEWAPIPEARLQLAAPGTAPLSREEAARRLAELDAAGLTKPRDGEFDHLRWARRVLARANAGDKTLEMAQIKFAKEALGVA